jgi:hypothetical protein
MGTQAPAQRNYFAERRIVDIAIEEVPLDIHRVTCHDATEDWIVGRGEKRKGGLKQGSFEQPRVKRRGGNGRGPEFGNRSIYGYTYFDGIGTALASIVFVEVLSQANKGDTYDHVGGRPVCFAIKDIFGTIPLRGGGQRSQAIVRQET